MSDNGTNAERKQLVVQLGDEAATVIRQLQSVYPMSARAASNVLARAFNKLSPEQQIDCLRRTTPIDPP